MRFTKYGFFKEKIPYLKLEMNPVKDHLYQMHLEVACWNMDLKVLNLKKSGAISY